MYGKKALTFVAGLLITILVFSTMLATSALASVVGDVFIGKIEVDGSPVDCTFKVISQTEVQVGNGTDPAIAQNTSGVPEIPDTITQQGNTYSVARIADSAFYGCSNITQTGLGKNASVTHVGNSAYALCTSLEDTGLSTNVAVQTLGSSVFYGCSALETTGFASNNTIVAIPSSTFASCTSLKDTGLSTNKVVTDILDSAFLACKSLENTGLNGNTSVLTIGTQAFSETAISNTGLGGNSSVAQIGDKAFEMCENLTDTGLYENTSVVMIGKLAFWYCTSLTNTGLHEDSPIVTLGAGAFYGCDSLGKYVELPNTLTSPVFHNSYAPKSADYDVFAETPVRNILFTNQTITPQARTEEWRNTYWQEETQFERAYGFYTQDMENASLFADAGGYSLLYSVSVQGGSAKLHDSSDAMQAAGTGFETHFKAGDIVQVNATIPENHVFETWQSDDVTFEQPTSSLTTFDMPEKNVNVKALTTHKNNVATHQISVIQANGITITPPTLSVIDGATQSFNIIAEPGYLIDKVIVDDKDIGVIEANSATKSYTYTFVDVSADHTITAQSKHDPNSVVDTGDDSRLTLYLIIAGVALLFIAGAIVFSRVMKSRLAHKQK